MNKSTEKRKKNKTVKSVFIALSLIFITVMCTACNRGDGHNGVGRINDVRKEKLDRGGIYAQVNDSGKALSEGQKELLESYAYKYAQTLCTLEPRDISGFFTGYTEDYYKNLTAYKTLTSIRKMSKNDMVLEYAQVTYNIQQVIERKSEVEVLLTEDNVQKFAHLSQPSYSYNLNHIFVLRQKDGQWFVKSHEQEEDFFLLSIEAWNDAAGGSYADKSENAVNILIADAQENIDELKISTGNQPEDIEVANTAYDRDAAVNYA